MTANIMMRFEMVMKKDDLARIDVKDNTITVDLHGLGTCDSNILLNNIINLNREQHEIRVIHGFNHGIALKDMINRRFNNARIIGRTINPNNPGMTILACAAAC